MANTFVYKLLNAEVWQWQFLQHEMHTASLHATFKNVRYGLFASLRTGYNYCPNNMLYAHQLNGIIYNSIATAYKRGGSTLYANGKLTKDFGGKVSVRLEAYFSQSNTYSLWNDNPVANRFRNINASISLSYRPCVWFSVEENSYLFHTENKREQTDDSDAYTQSTNTFNHTLDLFVTPKNGCYNGKTSSITALTGLPRSISFPICR